MMKSEFEEMLHFEVSVEDYKIIEHCYMEMENFFPDKSSVVYFYRTHGIDGFKALYKDISKKCLEEDVTRYAVISRVYDSGNVKCTIRKALPGEESRSAETKLFDMYIDVFDTEEEAKEYVSSWKNA